MRITGLAATPVAVPFRHDEVWAYGGRRGLVSVLIEMTTDEGVTGLGEAPAYPSADIVSAVLRSIEPLVLGEDPFRIERIIKRTDVAGTWHHVRATSPAIAAVEMACWDVVGKVCGQPLANLLGGAVRERAEYVYYLALNEPEEMGREAKRGAAAGFRTFYLKVGDDDPRVDIERVAAVRDGAGPRAGIRVDANEAWSAGEAIRMLGILERFDLEYAEQPVSGRVLEAMAYVRGRSRVPLLANEASWNRYDQLEVIRHGAADAVSVDNQMDGGLLNMKRSAGLCEAAALPVVKHSLGELGVGTYAALHVIASTPNFLPAGQSYVALLADDIIEGGPPAYAGGCLELPAGPGLGVALDHERVNRYAELFAKEGAGFAFGSEAAGTPLLPKR
jgi:L-alanine-DL-glutamate epimerase-like enolase superfamily enzyme